MSKGTLQVQEDYSNDELLPRLGSLVIRSWTPDSKSMNQVQCIVS